MTSGDAARAERPKEFQASSILARAADIRILDDPFPHFILPNALPEDYFLALADAYPGLQAVAGEGPHENNALYKKAAYEVLDDPSFAPTWRDFFALHTSAEFFREVVALWKGWIDRLYPGLERAYGRSLCEFTCGLRRAGREANPDNLREDITLDCQFAMNSPVLQASSVRGPHIDRQYKLFAAVLYFRHPRDDSTGGELEFYRYRDSRFQFRPNTPVDYAFADHSPFKNLKKISLTDVTPVLTVPYQPNTLVMWLNTPYSLHGVTPRSETPWPRRYVNVIGELYAGASDGLFRPRRSSRLLDLLTRGGRGR
jgi:hypothetical protein